MVDEFRFGWLRQTDPEKLVLPRDDDDERLNLAVNGTRPKATRDRSCGGGSGVKGMSCREFQIRFVAA